MNLIKRMSIFLMIIVITLSSPLSAINVQAAAVGGFSAITKVLVSMMAASGVIITADMFEEVDGVTKLKNEDEYQQYYDSMALGTAGMPVDPTNSLVADLAITGAVGFTATNALFKSVIESNAIFDSIFEYESIKPVFASNNFLTDNQKYIDKYYSNYSHVVIPSDTSVITAYTNASMLTAYTGVKNLLIIDNLTNLSFYNFDVNSRIGNRFGVTQHSYNYGRLSSTTELTMSGSFYASKNAHPIIAPNVNIYYVPASACTLSDTQVVVDDFLVFNEFNTKLGNENLSTYYPSAVIPTYKPLPAVDASEYGDTIDIVTDAQLSDLITSLESAGDDVDALKSTIKDLQKEIALNNAVVPETDFSSILDAIKSIGAILTSFPANIAREFDDLITGIPAQVASINDVVTGIPAQIATLFDDLITGVPGQIASLGELITDIPANIAKQFDDVITGIPAQLGSLADSIADIPSNVSKALQDAFASATADISAIKDGVIALPGVLSDSFANALSAIFIPSAQTVKDLEKAAYTTFPIIPELETFTDRFVATLNGDSKGLDFYVDFSRSETTIVNYGDTRVNMLDVAKFDRWKPLINDLTIGFLWLIFIWNLYGSLPSIISAASRSNMLYLNSQSRGDIQ